MRRALTIAFVAAACSGCGGSSGDVLAIEISGESAHRIVVANDGRARCDEGGLRSISPGQVIAAREIAEEASELAERGARLGGTPGGARAAYVLRTQDGSVGWIEGTRGLPAPLPRAELLALGLRRDLCGG